MNKDQRRQFEEYMQGWKDAAYGKALMNDDSHYQVGFRDGQRAFVKAMAAGEEYARTMSIID